MTYEVQTRMCTNWENVWTDAVFNCDHMLPLSLPDGLSAHAATAGRMH